MAAKCNVIALLRSRIRIDSIRERSNLICSKTAVGGN